LSCNPETAPVTDMHVNHPGQPDLAPPTPTNDMAMMVQTPSDLAVPVTPVVDMAAPQEGPKPFIVDDNFANSGVEGGGSPQGTISDDVNCPMRGGAGRGKCHHVQWTPGTSSWGGTVWQSPANNWGTATGFAIPSGYAQVRFWAWGKSGGEKLTFLTGLGADTSDKFKQSMDVTLGTQPKLYVLGVGNAYGDHVVSAFGWVTGAATAQTFYVDDIVWTGDEDATQAPLALEPTFGPSGYIGDGERGFVNASSCAAGGMPGCRHFEWDPNADGGSTSLGWAGVFWQSAPGNLAGATDPDGATVAAGYREIRFRARSTHGGGETVSFLAGMGAGTRDGFQSKLEVRLSATPTTYALGVGGAYGAHVVGGFGWVIGGGGGLGIDLEGTSWR